ncbi:hypothetical protein [Streptomyces sp. NBC_00459]|uniref:hypothetical protein n=1 Tax=Streptomyces sp. NBC_00459 TaxID=2975749 RepID=UPI002E18962D
MHDTPPGRPHRPEPDAGPDDELVGELRELMERAAAGLAPLPDLTQEAVRLGRRRRVRARAAVAGAVTGVLAIGGIGSALLSGALTVGGGLSDPASPSAHPAVAPPVAPSATTTPPTTTSPGPVSEPTPNAARQVRTAKALTRALGDLIGTVSPAGTDLFAGRIDGHIFPVTFRVRRGVDALVDCPEPPKAAMTCRTAWLPGRIEGRVVVSGPDLWGVRSVSVSYLYADSTVELTVGPDSDARVSPPVGIDQLVAAASTSALLAEAKYEVLQAKYEAEDAAGDGTESTTGPSLAPPSTAEPSSAEPSSATDSSSTGSTNETGGSPR